MKHSLEELRKHAKYIRLNILAMVTPTKSSHIGGAFSVVEFLTALYFEAMRIDPTDPQNPTRDILLYSKGHAVSALYATLVERGFAVPDILKEYHVDGGRLSGHPVIGNMSGVEFSSGSLGHGLPVGAGMAFARKRDRSESRVYVLLSDGECDEGSVWEAAMFAPHHGLDNLTAIIDYNKIQSFGSTKEVLDLEPLADKWRAFNWSVEEVDGHDFIGICASLNRLPFNQHRPSVIIAHTIKGKGVSFMENKLAWHYRSPNEEEYRLARKEVSES